MADKTNGNIEEKFSVIVASRPNSNVEKEQM